MVEALVIAFFIGLIPATIAHGKGKNFFGWWFYGFALWIVAFPHSLIMKKDQEALDRRLLKAGTMKSCPACAELVKVEATKCRFCGHDFHAR